MSGQAVGAVSIVLLLVVIRRLHETGGSLPYEVLLQLSMDAGEPLNDLYERWWSDRATGETFKTFFALANTDATLASWNNATKIAELIAKSFKAKGARTDLWDAKRRFLSVAHLWAARSIREGRSLLRPEVGYDASADFPVVPNRSRDSSSVGTDVAATARKERAAIAARRLARPRRMGAADAPA